MLCMDLQTRLTTFTTKNHLLQLQFGITTHQKCHKYSQLCHTCALSHVQTHEKTDFLTNDPIIPK